MFKRASILAIALFGVVSATASANAMNFVMSHHETAAYMYSGPASQATDAMSTGSIQAAPRTEAEPPLRLGVVSPRITGVNPYLTN